MSHSSSGNHHQPYPASTMIGVPPSTYRRQTQPQPSTGEMEATYQAYLQRDLPSSTVPSAAHSQSQHQVSTIDNAGYGLFEPVAGDPRFSNFSAILPGQAAPQSQRQQVPGEFIPGAGGGTNEWYQQRNGTVFSDHSGSSAAQLSSPVREASSQQSFSFPPNSNPNNFASPNGLHQLYYPDRHSSGSDFPSSTEHYTSPAAGSLSPDKHYMSSPEQMHYHQTQPMFSATGQAPLFGGQNITTGQAAPFGQPGPSPPKRPTRPIPGSTKITSQQGGGFNTGWGTIDTNAVAPGGGSAGSHSSGGGTNGAPYAPSNGSYSARSSQSQGRVPNAPRPSQSGATVGRSRSIGSHPHHKATQSMGYLAPPATHKRPRHEEPEEIDDSDGDDEPAQNVPTGRQQRSGGPRRL